MSGASLNPLQLRVLELLADVQPPWTLTGGAALVAVHLGHRVTRDLDLFWRSLDRLESVSRSVQEALLNHGMTVTVVQTGTTFERLAVREGSETVILDLIAETVASIEPPMMVVLGQARIQVDTMHEILVNKLCALLGRMELRDLEDVRVLLETGGKLEQALADAPRKDGGFSALTLAWSLYGLPVSRLAHALGWPDAETTRLEQFRVDFIELLTAAAAPD